MYHSTCQFPREREIPYDNIFPGLFKEHLRILKQGRFRVILLRELISLIQGNESIPPRTIVITFDDGYKNNVLNAFPLLQQVGFRATFFLIAGAIGAKKPFRHLLWDSASRICQSKNPFARVPMTWDDACELVLDGNDLGSHGMTHRSLGRMTPKESSAEILESKNMIERRTNISVTSFSYPFGSIVYGDLNESLQDALAESGYGCACATEIGPVKSTDNLFQLKRIPVREQDTPFFFKQKLIGAYDWVNRGKRFFQSHFPRIDKVC